MRIAIFGVGGVGGYFGGRLAQNGEEVVFIARGEHLRALQANGLQVDSVKGDFRVFPIQVVSDPRQAGPLDAVLLGVKAWQVREAARSLKPALGPETCVLPLQNGVEAAGQLIEELGPDPVLGGMCRISSLIRGPGHIAHVGLEPHVALGELGGGSNATSASSERVERLRAAFERSGVSVEVPADILVAIWNKFLFIAAVSGVGSVTRAPLGVVRKLPETRRMLAEVMQEIYNLAITQGVRLAEDSVSRTLAYIDTLPEKTVPSMQRDLVEGRPSELEAQNGAVVRLGRQAGLPTPVNWMLYGSLLPAELRARGELNY